MKKDIILIVLVVFLSIYNIYNNTSDLYSATVLVSAIGLTGFVLYMADIPIHKYFILTWILLQFPIIEMSEVLLDGAKVRYDVFNVSQFFINPKIGFGFSSPKTLHLSLNLVPFLYYFMYKFLLTKSFVSTKIVIFPVTEISYLMKYAPLEAKIVDVTDRRELIAKLDKSISIEGVVYDKIKFNTVDDSIFKPKKDRQECEVILMSGEIYYNESTFCFVK
ncbi:MAG: hypothetical protein HRT66_13550 [Flavobacteriaceae bacterium]|nr:hypothetical protein [Flavobacteriaceae bacterium]